MQHQKTVSKNSMTAKMIARAALMGGVTFVCGLIRISVGPVPITFQTFAVLLSGLILSPGEAFFAMLLNAVLKMIFGGFAVVVSPSFGFMIAFTVAAPLLAWRTKRTGGALAPMIVDVIAASLLLYVIGLPYMVWMLRLYAGQVMTLADALRKGMLIFLPGDAVKAALACFIGFRLRPRLISMTRS